MSLVAEQFSTNSVLLNSKKIKKVKKPLQSPESLTKADPGEDGNSNLKKYKTFQTTTKKAILFDIKRGIMQLYSMPYNDKELDSEELLKLVSKADLSAYNKLLREVLTKHISTFTSSQKSLTQWRKKIKGWLYTSEKPEYRGSPVVTSEKLPVFREEVIKILKELPFRCFSSLRQNILGVLLKFHKANPATQETPFNPNVCSKHWWFNFMQKNTDIKEMWEKIPLKRETSKHNIDLQGSQHSTENTSQEMEEEKTPNLLMTDPIFSSRFMAQGHEHTGDATSKHNIMGAENFSHIMAAARNVAFERFCREAFLMKLMTSLQIPPFQGQACAESTAVKIEAKPEPKVEAKVEVQNAKKEEPETVVKMEEEMIKLAKSANDS